MIATRCFTWQLLACFVNALQFHNVERPNLLFIMTDQQRFDALSSAGNTVLQTPNMDRIAREGVRFENAYTANPVCVPARASLLTGYSSVNIKLEGNKALDNPEVPDVPTFDSVLVDNGYSAEYYGKWHIPYKFTACYDNVVKTLKDSEEAYKTWLASNGAPPKEPGDGDLLDKRSMRPYTPIRLDDSYGEARASSNVQLRFQPEAQEETTGKESEYGQVDLPPHLSLPSFTVEETLEALERMKGGPFTLTCSFPPPHPPMVVQDPYYSMYSPDMIPVPESIGDSMEDSPYSNKIEGNPYRDASNIKEMRSIYYGMVKQVDDAVGKILDKLDELAIASQTLVLFVSDHGEMLGDHGFHGKLKFYEGAVHVPLMMRFPGRIKPGTVVNEPVSTMDIYATILDYMSVPIPQSDGQSLRPLIERTGPARDVISYSSGGGVNYMIRSGYLKLMINAKAESTSLDALYDLEADPLEMRNLIASPVSPEEDRAKAEQMKARLVQWLEKHEPQKLKEVEARKLF
eukprot:TRINITY_DN254_c0_g2_i1.p1 TRINITY_DN254_c0_g2~~TRINITY_DN254_c0_g2_i1.p1  ORF type:complete len:527 (-),score=60.19 TRINITY_DN254_c0_g2_i1:53-1603(-)